MGLRCKNFHGALISSIFSIDNTVAIFFPPCLILHSFFGMGTGKKDY